MHQHMACTVEEAAELTSLPEKLTVIYPTSQGPIECLLWTTFALLLRTKVNDFMEHFIVCINGPDKRTGDESICDKKQEFLEDLRKLKWYHVDNPKKQRDMPLTVIRVWSRIGHPEAVEMAMPWIHTDSYLITHDDVIICTEDWLREVERKFYNDQDVVIAYGHMGPHFSLYCCQCDSSTHNEKPILRVPHLLCAFLVCRKKYIWEMGSSWCGYHINTEPFMLEERVGDVTEFFKYYKNLGLLDQPPQTTEPYYHMTMEMGAWHFYNAIQRGYKFAPLNLNFVHFGAMSWEVDTGKKNRIQRYMHEVRRLEEKIYAHPDYGPLYDKYLPEVYKQ